ncbi:MAG: GAF domain-containing protein [Bryobacteraceae bacterium]
MELVESVKAGSGDLSEVLRLAIAHFGADSGTIHMLAADGLLHLEAASDGIPDPVLAVIRQIPVGKGMAGLAVERCEPVSACNIQTGSSTDVRPGARATGMEGAIVVPILRGDRAVGALGIANRRERTFSEEETALLIRVGRAIAERLAA